jgi:hypothetical protein
MVRAASTGQRISTAAAVLLLVTATVLARPDRNPIAWLLTRPDRWALLRLVGVLGGLPLRCIRPSRPAATPSSGSRSAVP